MSELIVAGFDDAHTAFLARAALARMEGDLQLIGHDVAVVSLEQDYGVTIREAIALQGERARHEAFWRTMASALFSMRSGSEPSAASGLSVIGADDALLSKLAETVKPGTSAILIIVNQTITRDRVIDVLSGFQARIIRSRLIGEDRQQWLAQLVEHRDGDA